MASFLTIHILIVFNDEFTLFIINLGLEHAIHKHLRTLIFAQMKSLSGFIHNDLHRINIHLLRSW